MHLCFSPLLRVWLLPEMFHILHDLRPSPLQGGVGHCYLQVALVVKNPQAVQET